MKSVILLTATAIFLAGCATTPAPLCDREAQVWDKFQTVEDECKVPAVVAPIVVDGGGTTLPPTDPKDPVDPKPPVDPKDPVDPPSKVKDDNSDANGKGGNKHDREDKDKLPQEIAENKKGV